MQDRNGQDSDYLLPGTWYLSPVPNSPISNLNRALLPYCPTALLPYCPIALLPDCPTASTARLPYGWSCAHQAGTRGWGTTSWGS